MAPTKSSSSQSSGSSSKKQKAINLRKALGKAIPSKLVGTASGGSSKGKNTLEPIPGEPPLVALRVQVVECKNLHAKDKGGTSDPYVQLTLLATKHETPTVKKTVSPKFFPPEATFDFPLHLSLADRLGALQVVVWDKDMLSKDYLGEVALGVDDWFPAQADKTAEMDWERVQERTFDLLSTRNKTPASGSVTLRIGFLRAPPAPAPGSAADGVTHREVDPSLPFSEIYKELVRAQRWNLTSVPPTATIGTLPPSSAGPAFADDGFSSDEDDDQTTDTDTDGYSDADDLPAQLKGGKVPLALRGHQQDPIVDTEATPIATQPPPFPLDRDPTIKAARPPVKKQSSMLAQKILRRGSKASISSVDSDAAPKKERRRKKRLADDGFRLGGEDDVVGIVMLDIKAALDLPRMKTMTRIGWDMDPFVVISFGKKVFRTRVIRHSRSPEWNEKLLFHVKRYETNFNIKFSVLDWDKISTHDMVGEAIFNVGQLISEENKDARGLYQGDAKPTAEEKDEELREFTLPLTPGEGTSGDLPWEAKHKPEIKFSAKYQPYSVLRRRFWLEYLKQYDADDTRTISHLELTSMLESLGSTLSRPTVDGFWTRHGKDPRADDLSMEECVTCLEEALMKPRAQRQRLDDADYSASALPTGMNTPSGRVSPAVGLEAGLAQVSFAGPAQNVPEASEGTLKPQQPAPHATEGGQEPISRASSSGSDTDTDTEVEAVERVINVRNCPLCHRPRMGARAEVDIVTHMAVCASQDWGRVDRMIVGNFVTSSQAQRKWYTKLIGKATAGAYQLGANSANIIVQNRMTGQLEEEKMQVYVRLGIRLLYKGAKSRMEGGRARHLLKSMSIKQGVKYDSPDSAKDIQPFLEFHRLNVNEILDPLDSFKTFNQFFYRKLKPDARLVEMPDDHTRLVSGADCRMMAFETVQEATKIWIKGREFTIARLLGLDNNEAGKREAERWEGGSLCIFRLAPQDYHRFHSPVDGTVGAMRYIAGEYYTVNPQAIRSPLDVYGENARKIVPIDSPAFGRTVAVCIGAMMVGSIVTTVEEGQQIKRGQEFGYFAFGGSTIVMLFEKGVVDWDEDLVINGRASLETLVRVGMGVGRSKRTGVAQVGPPQPKGISYNASS